MSRTWELPLKKVLGSELTGSGAFEKFYCPTEKLNCDQDQVRKTINIKLEKTDGKRKFKTRSRI